MSTTKKAVIPRDLLKLVGRAPPPDNPQLTIGDQCRDHIAREHLHQRAALYIIEGEQLAACDPDEDEIVLVGTYHDNAAYQSRQYWAFQGYKIPAVLSA